MKPSEALALHREELRRLVSRYAVARPRVYGSALTGKDDEDSDLDILVDATEFTTLFTLVGLEHEAQELLGVRVSVLTPGFLPVRFREHVLQLAQPL
jgi:predicted nucleotidyltransferase